MDLVGGAAGPAEGVAAGLKSDVAARFELIERVLEVVVGSDMGADGTTGVAAGEAREAGSLEPGEQDGGLGEGWIEAHRVVGGAGVGDEGVGDGDGGVDRGKPHPPTAARREHRLRRRPSPLRWRGGANWGVWEKREEGGEVGEVEEAGNPRGCADELAGPVDDGVEVAAGGEAGLDGAGEVAEAVGGGGVEEEGEKRAPSPRPPLPR